MRALYIGTKVIIDELFIETNVVFYSLGTCLMTHLSNYTRNLVKLIYTSKNLHPKGNISSCIVLYYF